LADVIVGRSNSVDLIAGILELGSPALRFGWVAPFPRNLGFFPSDETLEVEAFALAVFDLDEF
jgi:hypothetical protein